MKKNVLLLKIIAVVVIINFLSGCATKKGYYVIDTPGDYQKEPPAISDKDMLKAKKTESSHADKNADIVNSKAIPDELSGRWFALNCGKTYEVQKGDSLWKIAARKDVYGNGYMWVKIYTANRDVIGKENFIYPGQLLIIPDRKGN